MTSRVLACVRGRRRSCDRKVAKGAVKPALAGRQSRAGDTRPAFPTARRIHACTVELSNLSTRESSYLRPRTSLWRHRMRYDRGALQSQARNRGPDCKTGPPNLAFFRVTPHKCLRPACRLCGEARRSQLRPLHCLLLRQVRLRKAPQQAAVAVAAAMWHRQPIALCPERASPKPLCDRRPLSRSQHLMKMANN
jgi:hypothetical protein